MDLHLPQTRLVLSDGALTHLGPDDKPIASFPIGEVEDIQFQRRLEFTFPLILVATFGALAAISKIYIPYAGLSWAGTVICGAIAFFCLTAVDGREIIVVTRDGTLNFPVSDTFEEAHSFVLSVKRQLSL